MSDKPTGVTSSFNIEDLAKRILVLEDEAKKGFVAKIFAIADMLGAGLRDSCLGVTRYTTQMASALGRSESYIDKYLRLNRLPPEKRAAVDSLSGFNAVWRACFPGPEKSKPSPPEPTAEEKADAPTPPAPEPSEEEPEPEAPPTATTAAKPTPATDGLVNILSALEANDLPGALANITLIRQREQAAVAEAERLRREVERLKKERDTILAGGPIGELLRVLRVKNIKQALAAVKEMKSHAA